MRAASHCLAPTVQRVVVAHPSLMTAPTPLGVLGSISPSGWNSAQQQHVAMSISITGTRFLITKKEKEKKSIIQDEAGQQEQGPSVPPT